jgi:hypothetical protein
VSTRAGFGAWIVALSAVYYAAPATHLWISGGVDDAPVIAGSATAMFLIVIVRVNGLAQAQRQTFEQLLAQVQVVLEGIGLTGEVNRRDSEASAPGTRRCRTCGRCRSTVSNWTSRSSTTFWAATSKGSWSTRSWHSPVISTLPWSPKASKIPGSGRCWPHGLRVRPGIPVRRADVAGRDRPFGGRGPRTRLSVLSGY